MCGFEPHDPHLGLRYRAHGLVEVYANIKRRGTAIADLTRAHDLTSLASRYSGMLVMLGRARLERNKVDGRANLASVRVADVYACRITPGRRSLDAVDFDRLGSRTETEMRRGARIRCRGDALQQLVRTWRQGKKPG